MNIIINSQQLLVFPTLINEMARMENVILQIAGYIKILFDDKKSGKKLNRAVNFKCNGTIVHKGKYDYKNVIYINNKLKVIIICPIIDKRYGYHGIFEQAPQDHTKGHGCPICARITVGNALRLTLEQFLKKAFKKHENRYDYSKVIYEGTEIKIIIICSRHGEFKQRPHDHLAGKGCMNCAHEYLSQLNRNSLKKVLRGFRLVHGNRYDYSKVIYINNKTDIIIVCSSHGEFEQTPDNHVNNHGCPSCARNKYSQICIKWLGIIAKYKNIAIRHAENGGETKLLMKDLGLETKYPNKKHIELDGTYLNTVFEYHGCLWHGCPSCYKPDYINVFNKLPMDELYKKTIIKDNIIRDLGYNLVIIWECEFKRLIKSQDSIVEYLTDMIII